MITSKLKDVFWESVASCLVEFHSCDPGEAHDLAFALRDRIETEDDDESASTIAYHAEPFDIACDIAGKAPDEQEALRTRYNDAYLELLQRSS